MKKDSLIVILLLIIIGLILYIIIDKTFYKDNQLNDKVEEVKLKEELELNYASIILYNDGNAYIKPINKNEIIKLNEGKNLKERLNTLYDKAFYYDVFINNNKLKAYLVKIDKKVNSIRKIEIEDSIYVIFIKEDNTISLLDFDKYYNEMNTSVIDNYNNYQNVKDIINNSVIYLDGSSEKFYLEK